MMQSKAKMMNSFLSGTSHTLRLPLRLLKIFQEKDCLLLVPVSRAFFGVTTIFR
jgi:hypothetical protein